MTVHVRKHQRELASGKTSTVRAHDRNTPGEGGCTMSASDEAWDRPSSHGASSGPSGTLERMKADMRRWRSEPAPRPQPEAPMHPGLAKALGCDTPEGRAKYDRGRALREAGYDGPLDKNNNIPDPDTDDPETQDALSTLAHMKWMEES